MYFSSISGFVLGGISIDSHFNVALFFHNAVKLII